MNDQDTATLLSVLAAIVNRAGRSEDTTAEAMKTARVPVALLEEARGVLAGWASTDYTTAAIRNAAQRLFGKEG